MPKATLEYDLSKPDEQDALQTAMDASKYKAALWDIDQWLRSEVKYKEDLSDELRDKYDELRSKIRNKIEEYGITSWW